MMTLPDIQAELGRVSYRPGWSIVAWQHHGVDLAPGVVVRLDAAGHLMMGYRSVIPCFKPWAHIPLRDRCLLLVPMILSAAALSRRTYGGAEASR